MKVTVRLRRMGRRGKPRRYEVINGANKLEPEVRRPTFAREEKKGLRGLRVSLSCLRQAGNPENP